MRGQAILLELHHRTQALSEESFRKNGSTGKPFICSARRSPSLNYSDLAEKCPASSKYGLLRPKGTVMSKIPKYSTKKKRQHSITVVMVLTVLENLWEQSDSLYFPLHQGSNQLSSFLSAFGLPTLLSKPGQRVVLVLYLFMEPQIYFSWKISYLTVNWEINVPWSSKILCAAQKYTWYKMGFFFILKWVLTNGHILLISPNIYLHSLSHPSR